MATATGLNRTRGRAKVVAPTSPTKGQKMAAKPRKRLTAAEKRTSEGKFAVVLEQLMSQRGVTSQQLADAIGVKEPTVRQWLRAAAIPGDVRLFKKIAKYLHSAEFPIPDWRLIIPADL